MRYVRYALDLSSAFFLGIAFAFGLVNVFLFLVQGHPGPYITQ